MESLLFRTADEKPFEQGSYYLPNQSSLINEPVGRITKKGTGVWIADGGMWRSMNMKSQVQPCPAHVSTHGWTHEYLED